MPENLKSGITIFGVEGKLHGGCTCEGTLNGKRWCDNGDGTVTDLRTCLVWYKDAGCADSITWDAATIWAGVFKPGVSGCVTLSDGSLAGDWRLPTVNELWVLFNENEPVRSDTPRAFVNVPPRGAPNFYWTSSTYAPDHSWAWLMYAFNGGDSHQLKTGQYRAWPVRNYLW